MSHIRTKEEYEIAIKNAKSIAQALRNLGIKDRGGNYRIIKNAIDKYQIDTSHFMGQGWNVNLIFNPKPKIKTEDLLVENSNYNSYKLKKRLLSEGYKEKKCECCGLTEWNNKPISLQIHHINGKHNDNRIENLQILCPNCHSQTDSYAGKNSNRENQTENKGATKYYCMKKEEWENFRENRWKKTHPSKETLINAFIEYGSFLKLGKLYGVSDKAIVKWFKHYNLPSKKKELKDYIHRCSQEVDGISLQN